MLVGVILATALGGTFAVAGARHMRKRWLGFRRLEAFELSLLELRADTTAPFPWRAARPGDAAEVAPLELAHTDDRALVANGFRRLGDAVAIGRVRSAVRTYADADATTLAMVQVANERVHFELRSYASDGRRFATIRGARARLAMPPDVRVVEHRADAAVPHLVSDHRARLGTVQLVAFETFDAVLARIAASHDATCAWRAAQAPDALLDADLRAILRAQYARLGPIWRARLRSRVPVATLRR